MAGDGIIGGDICHKGSPDGRIHTAEGNAKVVPGSVNALKA